MNQKSLQTLALRGILTTVQPVTVSPPGVAHFNDARRDDVPKRMPRAGESLKATRYIPAATLRHIVRDGIATIATRILQERGTSMPLPALLVLNKGFTKMKRNGAKGKENGANKEKQSANKQNSKSFFEKLNQERLIREKNPLLSLLGCWEIPSELRVGNAIPSNDLTNTETLAVTPGVVRKPLNDAVSATLQDADLAEYHEIIASSAEKDSKDTGLIHYAPVGWEEIPAGVDCDWSIQVHRADAFKVGAVLAALRLFASDPRIGGHAALGRGEIAIRLSADSIVSTLLDVPMCTPWGEVAVARGTFNVEGEKLKEALSIFDEEARAGFPNCDFQVIPVVKEDDVGSVQN